MFGLLHLWLLAGAFVYGGSLDLVERDSPAVFQLPFSKVTRNKRSINRRQQDTVTVSLENEVTLYLANVSIGVSRKQLVFLALNLLLNATDAASDHESSHRYRFLGCMDSIAQICFLQRQRPLLQ